MDDATYLLGISWKRVWKAGTKDYGQQVPAGTPVLGCMYWLIAFMLILVGAGTLLAGGHHRLLLAIALWVGALLFVAQTFVSDKNDDDPSR